jgi:hypothetical protein
MEWIPEWNLTSLIAIMDRISPILVEGQSLSLGPSLIKSARSVAPFTTQILSLMNSDEKRVQKINS